MSDLFIWLAANSWLVALLGGAVAALVLRELLDWRRRPRGVITYFISSTVIAERTHPELAITYQTLPIKRLYSHKIYFHNTGNQSAKNLPLRLDTDGGTIVKPQAKGPSGATTTVSPEKPTNSISVQCDLLNPGEHLELSFLSLDAVSEKLTPILRDPLFTLVASAQAHPPWAGVQAFFSSWAIVAVGTMVIFGLTDYLSAGWASESSPHAFLVILVAGLLMLGPSVYIQVAASRASREGHE